MTIDTLAIDTADGHILICLLLRIVNIITETPSLLVTSIKYGGRGEFDRAALFLGHFAREFPPLL
jgi:hypothetical protein